MECQGNPMEKLLIDFKLLRGAAHLNEPVKRFLLKNHDHYITISLARSNMQDLFSVLECWIFASINPKSSTDGLSLSVQTSLLGYFMASQYCWWITNRALLVWLFLARPPSAVLSPPVASTRFTWTITRNPLCGSSSRAVMGHGA